MDLLWCCWIQSDLQLRQMGGPVQTRARPGGEAILKKKELNTFFDGKVMNRKKKEQVFNF